MVDWAVSLPVSIMDSSAIDSSVGTVIITSNMARSSAQFARPGFLVNGSNYKKKMAIPYLKPHLTYEAQLHQLKQRGLVVENDANALWHLRSLGYYRLSGYFYPFRVLSTETGATPQQCRDSAFIEGASFDQVAALYRFDSELRMVTMRAIDKLEVAVRAKVAYHMGAQDPIAHTNSNLVNPKFSAIPSVLPGEEGRPSNYATWLDQHTKLLNRSKEDFIRHFREKYEPPVPIWVSVEVWDFGLLSHYFAGLRDQDKRALASDLGLPRHVLLASWLRTISHVRNICAHHSRLWNRTLIDNPKPPARGEVALLAHLSGQHSANMRDHVYGALAVVQYLLINLGFGTEWSRALKEMISRFPTAAGVATLEHAGFPDKWEHLPLWAD